MSITVEDMLNAYSLAYVRWLVPESERENPAPEYARLIRQVVEHEYADLKAENAKLRELVGDMFTTISWCDIDCYPSDDKKRELADRMRELGVEV